MSSTSKRITVAVSDYWILGTLPLENSRIQEVLSDPNTDFLQLRDVEIHKLADCACISKLQNLFVPKDRIEFILVSCNAHEAPDKRWNNRKSKDQYSAFAIVSEHCIDGYLHLDAKPSDARYVLSHQLGIFFPLTDATVRLGGRGARELSVPLLFANIDFVNGFELGDHVQVEGSRGDQPASSQQQGEERNLTGLLESVRRLLDESQAATETSGNGANQSAPSSAETSEYL